MLTQKCSREISLFTRIPDNAGWNGAQKISLDLEEHQAIESCSPSSLWGSITHELLWPLSWGF